MNGHSATGTFGFDYRMDAGARVLQFDFGLTAKEIGFGDGSIVHVHALPRTAKTARVKSVMSLVTGFSDETRDQTLRGRSDVWPYRSDRSLCLE